MKTLLLRLLFLITSLFASAYFFQISAATFTVNDTGDSADANPGDGTCDEGKGLCTLRAAIEEANAYSGADIIEFNIPGTSPYTIMPLSYFPNIIETTTINGCTQPGANCSTVPTTLAIEIDGSSAGFTDGLIIDDNDGSEIRGLSITNYSSSAIVLSQATNAVIRTNFLGLDPSGRIAKPNNIGIFLRYMAKYNTIGGVNPTDANLISGNSTFGIEITETARGDYILTTSFNNIYGNFIGTNFYFDNLGNGSSGIMINQMSPRNGHPPHHIYVGGIASGQKNYVMYNDGNGVDIYDSGQSFSNPIRGNNISFNKTLGIDLNGDGVTPNDNGDPDGFCNKTMNYPDLIEAIKYGGNIYISYQLDTIDSGSAGGDYLVDFYGSTASNSSGYGEGEELLCTGSINVASTGVIEDAFYTCPTATSYNFISAINTDPNEDSSEFSNTLEVIEAQLGLSQRVVTLSQTGSNFTAQLALRVENSGDTDINNLQIELNLNSVFPSPATFIVQSTSSSVLSTNPIFNGNTDNRILAGTDTLSSGAIQEVLVNIIVTPNAPLGSYQSIARSTGTIPAHFENIHAEDLSTDGSVADANSNGDPGDDQIPTPLEFTGGLTRTGNNVINGLIISLITLFFTLWVNARRLFRHCPRQAY